jgi:hypothetical protein
MWLSAEFAHGKNGRKHGERAAADEQDCLQRRNRPDILFRPTYPHGHGLATNRCIPAHRNLPREQAHPNVAPPAPPVPASPPRTRAIMADIRSLCVYCGSSPRVDEKYKTAAARLGALIAARGLQLVYGGGRVGLMGITADAALGAGGQVVGIIPEHIQALEVQHTGLTELHVVDTIRSR